MGQMLRTLAVAGLLLSVCSSQVHDKRVVPMGYDLYSWQDAKGEWNFCVLLDTNSQKTVKQVFDKRTALRGVDQLKRKLSELPEGASVLWFNRIPLGPQPKAKGSEGLGYPPPNVVEEIQKYAEARKIKVEVLPSERNGAGE